LLGGRLSYFQQIGLPCPTDFTCTRRRGSRLSYFQ
jgi:hypothetical protein